MSYISKLLAVTTIVTAVSFQATAETVIVEAPGAKSYGSLRVNGEVSKDPQAKIVTDRKGKKAVNSGILTAQEEKFQACRFERNSAGTSKRGSMSDCSDYALNKDTKLQVGSYFLIYSNSMTIAEVVSGEKKVINLAKIQAPRVEGKSIISLYVDYKTEREQNKYLFLSRAQLTQDIYSALQAEYWARNFLKPYIDSGSYGDVPSEVRQAYFGTTGEFCTVDIKGIASECALDRVGAYSEKGRRSVCKVKNVSGFSFFGGIYSYEDENCKHSEVTYNTARAYFLVFPGVYTMKWSETYWEGEDNTLSKSGIVVN